MLRQKPTILCIDDEWDQLIGYKELLEGTGYKVLAATYGGDGLEMFHSAYQILAIAQKCSDVSLHLYTVSESVNALFVRTMQAQGSVNQQAEEVLNTCAASLKNAIPKKQR